MAKLHTRASVNHGFHYTDFHVTQDLLNSNTWRYPVLSYTQIGQAMRKVRVETYLRPQGSINCHRTDFSRKPDYMRSQTQRRTDGWTWVPHKELLSISKGRLKTSRYSSRQQCQKLTAFL